MIEAVQEARVYIYTDKPCFKQWSETLSKLSIVIEKSRGVFCNVNGLFPFEPLRLIYDDIVALGCDEAATAERRRRVGDAINQRWKLLREQLLRELDRCKPTYHNAWYAELKNQQ